MEPDGRIQNQEGQGQQVYPLAAVLMGEVDPDEEEEDTLEANYTDQNGDLGYIEYEVDDKDMDVDAAHYRGQAIESVRQIVEVSEIEGDEEDVLAPSAGDTAMIKNQFRGRKKRRLEYVLIAKTPNKDGTKEQISELLVLNKGESSNRARADRRSTMTFKVWGFCRIFDELAGLYHQPSAPVVQELALTFKFSPKMPTTLEEVWCLWFVSEEDRPSIWRLEAFAKDWRRKKLSKNQALTFNRQKSIVENVVELLRCMEGLTLKDRITAAKNIVHKDISAIGSISAITLIWRGTATSRGQRNDKNNLISTFTRN
ncbi:hypothetical protein BGX24_007564 [Mortierella sp. AD032]|nr:hypothetical protein BGX24_007564 [Mortierella sp. AD032]